MTYTATHASMRDGSTAMMESETDTHITFVNEDGFHWIDPKEDWVILGQETDEDRERWRDLWEEEEDDTYTSGEDYYASYINSDSYINYLNG